MVDLDDRIFKGILSDEDIAHWTKGMRLHEEGRYDASIVELTTFLDFVPRHERTAEASARWGLGMCYQDMGQPERALVHYRLALECFDDKPDDPQKTTIELAIEALFIDNPHLRKKDL